MKKTFAILIVAALAVGYVLRDRWVPLTPVWAQAYAAKVDPALAPKTAATTAAAKAGAKGAGGGKGGGPVAVSVTAATSGTLPVQRSTIGTVVAVDTTQLASEIAGTVAKVLVADGAEVKAGDLIVQLDDSALRAQVAKDEAQIAKDQASLASAQDSYDRTQPLVQSGVATTQSGVSAEAALKVAQGTLGVDKAALALDQVALTHTQIRAPFDGRLGAVAFSAGAYVSPGTALVRITRMKPVLVQFSLPVTDLSLLRKTQAAGSLSVAVSPVLDSGTTKAVEKGQVTFIDNAVDASAATVNLRARLDNQDEALWPGQPVSVTVEAGTTPELTLVPGVAVMPHADGSVVYVVGADGTASSRPVTVLLRDGDTAGISAGLKPGEKVVVEGQAAVLPGAKVKVVAPKPAGGAGAKDAKQGQAEAADGATTVTKS